MTRVLCFSDDVDTVKSLVSIGRRLGDTHLLLIGSREEAEEAARYGAERVYYAELKPYSPGKYVRALIKAAEIVRQEVTVMPSTVKGRTIAGIYSGLKGQPCLTDVIDVRAANDQLEVSRLAFGGTALVKVKTGKPLILCVSPGMAAEVEAGEAAPVEKLDVEAEDRVRVEYRPREVSEVEPDKADVVVVAGKGFKKREDLGMAIELARLLGGAWGVTRPLAADYGWASTWIGMTGITIKPKLYIGIGVSGQPYHMIGVRASKTIVSINIDPGAPIFEESDYGIIGDLYQILPRLIKRVKEVRG
jgi:electron transfer flavoprotein alpha subunit